MTTAGATVPVTAIDDPRGGVVRRGQRLSSSSTTTTEGGVLRLDSVPLQNGRIYLVCTNSLFFASSVAADVITGRLRYNAAGTATTSSTIIGEGGTTQPTTTSFGTPVTELFVPPSTANYSILLSVARIGGTGNVSIAVATNHPSIELFVLDVTAPTGDPGDTGIDI